jgi:hypothetical protein
MYSDDCEEDDHLLYEFQGQILCYDCQAVWIRKEV